MPPELHAEVARKAELERVSLNQFITSAVADAVGGQTGDSAELAGSRPLASSRTIKAALLVNLVVVTLAGIAAVTLLVLAWRGTL